MIPWDELRLSQVEAVASTCPDACAADVVSLIAEVRRLRRDIEIDDDIIARLHKESIYGED